MPTGSAFAAFNLKQLLGWQDLGSRGLAAIRASHIEATQARWDITVVCNNPPINNQRWLGLRFGDLGDLRIERLSVKRILFPTG